MSSELPFVLGLDLDGTCADFYGRMREIAAEWTGQAIEELTDRPEYGLKAWGIKNVDEYMRLHRFAVTERDLFETVEPLPGAASSLRRLAHRDGIRVRIITHRLFISHFHETAVAQTVRWLEVHGIPYWDLCFMREKERVDADLYVEDSPGNIESLLEQSKSVLIYSNSTNEHLKTEGALRANTWAEAEDMIRKAAGL